MVHGLETLKRLNDAATKANNNGSCPPVSLDRRTVNRPWTREEYRGPTPQETYAESAALPFRKTGRSQAETIRK